MNKNVKIAISYIIYILILLKKRDLNTVYEESTDD